MLDSVRRDTIRKLGLTITVQECKREKTCCACGGPLSPGDWEVPIDSGEVAHTHCADDLEIELR